MFPSEINLHINTTGKCTNALFYETRYVVSAAISTFFYVNSAPIRTLSAASFFFVQLEQSKTNSP